jgi:hypothetical protein
MALLMCLLVGVASATETVVDTRSPVADDKNPGTRDLLFRTIQRTTDVPPLISETRAPHKPPALFHA